MKYTYGGEQRQLAQVVQNLWAEISHPVKANKCTQNMCSSYNVSQCAVRFRQHTSLTCMTLLNNSCPLNIAVQSLRNVYQMGFKWTAYACTEIPMQHSFQKKDTDSLDCFNGHIKGYGSHSSAFPLLVLQNVRSHHNARHTENLLQLLPAHFVVKLQAQEQFLKMVTCVGTGMAKKTSLIKLQVLTILDQIKNCTIKRY